jgi:hypothetical protein
MPYIVSSGTPFDGLDRIPCCSAGSRVITTMSTCRARLWCPWIALETF